MWGQEKVLLFNNRILYTNENERSSRKGEARERRRISEVMSLSRKEEIGSGAEGGTIARNMDT